MIQILLAVLLAVLPACGDEGDTNCIWNAGLQGNGAGDSFIDIEGQAFYLKGVIAP